jgi:hypothetical protein
MPRRPSPLEANARDALYLLFSKEEIGNLCFELGFDKEDLADGAKQTMAQNLVEMAVSAGRINYLARLILRDRPNAKLFHARAERSDNGASRLYRASEWDEPTVG